MNWVEFIGYILITIYIGALTYVTLFCFMQLHLLFKYMDKGQINAGVLPAENNNPVQWPYVTIQLPVYNEQYVIERLIDNIATLDYPKNKFEIHILDDSADETTALAMKKVEEYKQQGFNIERITRDQRTGYKAGALKAAMPQANGEFIAIFDADFLPYPDFLKKTIPAFIDPKVGVVQTRWEHINQDYSLLTEMQALQLNVHFTIEQKGRYQAGYMLQFNGTAGVWRTSCILDAGGWEADTLTEDLDLSYRAQMKGWSIIYLESVTAPAELPAEINGLKSQQFRWMKGGAETARKLLPNLWRSNLSFSRKFQATVHLLSSSIFIFVFLLGVLSVPILFFLTPLGIDAGKFSIFMTSLAVIILVYYVANVEVAWPKGNKMKMIIKFLALFPVFLSLSMGLAFHNSLAVIQGFWGKKSAFIRTPKYGIKLKADQLSNKSYLSKKINWIAIGEGVLSVYFFTALYIGMVYDLKSFLVLHLMLAVGYMILFIYALQSKLSK